MLRDLPNRCHSVIGTGPDGGSLDGPRLTCEVDYDKPSVFVTAVSAEVDVARVQMRPRALWDFCTETMKVVAPLLLQDEERDLAPEDL